MPLAFMQEDFLVIDSLTQRIIICHFNACDGLFTLLGNPFLQRELMTVSSSSALILTIINSFMKSSPAQSSTS